MRIEESFIEKQFYIETNDLYNTALEFTDRIIDTGFGKPIESQNDYLTDGPIKKVVMVFDIMKIMDSFSALKFSFFISGETQYLRTTKPKLNIHTNAVLITEIKEYGPVSEAVVEFYLKSVYPKIRKRTEDNSNAFYLKILNIIQTLQVKSTPKQT